MSTPAHVPCQSSAWHLCTPCSHRELGHFSWLAVLFGGFSISGLSQCDTKELFEWLVFAPDEFTWPKLWWLFKVAWLVKAWVKGQAHLVSLSVLLLCFSLSVGFCQLHSRHCGYQSYFRFAALHGRPTFSLWNFGVFLKCYRGICTILKTLAVYTFFSVRGNYFWIFYAPQ